MSSSKVVSSGFNATASKTAFNRAVAAHKLNGSNPTQVRPKIKSIGKLIKSGPNKNTRLLSYVSGHKFQRPESDIAGIIHSYTELVAMLTGDATLIYLPFYFDGPLVEHTLASSRVVMIPPYVKFMISLGVGYLVTTIKNPDTAAAAESWYNTIHQSGVAGFGTRECESAIGGTGSSSVSGRSPAHSPI